MTLVLDQSKNAALPSAKRAALQMAIDTAEVTARRVANYPPALMPVSVAQFLLESDWGRADAGGAKNFFGIKARGDEPFVERKTFEVVEGKTVAVMAKFRKFSSVAECFQAHADLICNRSRGDHKIYARALEHPSDPRAFAQALTGVYATDQAYGAKLIRVMQDRGLLGTFGFTEAEA
jgi:flagellum-specific peptidoglycan hydrolase FlgJ